MHLLLITHYWAPEQGVVQRRWQWLNRAILNDNIELSVIAPPPHYPGGKLLSSSHLYRAGTMDNSVPGLTIYRTRFKEHNQSIISRIIEQATTMTSSLPTGLRVIRKAKSAHPVDAIICTVPTLPSAFVAYTLSRLTGKPLIVELRDAWPEVLHYLDQWHGARRANDSWVKSSWAQASPLYKAKWFAFHLLIATATRMLDRVLKSADLLITTTSTLAELKHENGCRNVEVVRNRARPAFANCEDNHQRTEGSLRVLYAGTIGRAQGLDNALKALEITKYSGVNIELRMVGGGAHLRSLKAYAEANDLPVTFVPRIPYDEIPAHYAWADTVLVHLQDWEPMQYTIPSKLFEAMWAQKHITACVAGEAADIVTEAQNGDVIPPMNPHALAAHWIELALHPQRTNVHGKATLWFAQHPTPDELSHRWINAVRSVVAEDQSQPRPRRRPSLRESFRRFRGRGN